MFMNASLGEKFDYRTMFRILIYVILIFRKLFCDFEIYLGVIQVWTGIIRQFYLLLINRVCFLADCYYGAFWYVILDLSWKINELFWCRFWENDSAECLGRF